MAKPKKVAPPALPTKRALSALSKFIHERQRIYVLRSQGAPAPWTGDELLRKYRFTNIYRENDRVTKWIFENWLYPNEHHQDVWFAMAVARLVNWPETLEEIGYPKKWSSVEARRMVNRCEARAAEGRKVFTSAYIINQAVTGGYGMKKADYLATVVFPDLWAKREEVRPRAGDTLQSFHARLMGCYGMGPFLAAQVVADVKHAEGPLYAAEDWFTWAAPGPGSRRGLNILLGRDPSEHMREADWLFVLRYVQQQINATRDNSVLPTGLDAQNMQNCLCEYSKYVRGYSRATFSPHQQE